MAQKKPPRILFNPDHIEVARELLSEKDAGRLFFAIYDYAMSGKMPENEPKSWLVCFKLMRGDIDRDLEKYAAKCEKNRQNVQARWNRDANERAGVQSNTTVCNGIPANTTVCEAYPTQRNTTQLNAAVVSTAQEDTTSPIIGFDGTDLTEDMENCAHADELVQRYKLPDTDQSREALLEDATRLGWEAVEDALRRAALGNARAMLSVNFYRRFFEDTGQGGKRCDSFADYGYERF